MDRGVKKFNILSEETLLPIGFVILLLGGSAWATNMYADIGQSKNSIIELKSDNQGLRSSVVQLQVTLGAMNENLRAINARLERIEQHGRNRNQGN